MGLPSPAGAAAVIFSSLCPSFLSPPLLLQSFPLHCFVSRKAVQVRIARDNRCATRINALVRGYLGRRRIFGRWRDEQDLYWALIIHLQRITRGFVHRRKAQHRYRHALVLQRFARSVIRYKVEAVIVIQVGRLFCLWHCQC